MARLLYRLGRFSARRAWMVIVGWVLVLGVLGGAAATLSTPFTSRLTIPGTEFQRVIDDLTTALPDASHGSAPAVFSTIDGRPFTADQKKAIAEVVAKWKQQPTVADALDPFATQQQLDEATTKAADGAARLADGEKNLAAGEATLADGRVKLADGRKQVDANAAKLADGGVQLAAAEAKLADGGRQIDANAATLAASQKRLDATRATLDAGQRDLGARSATLAGGQQQLEAGRNQLAAGRAQLATETSQLDALAAQVGETDPQVVAGRARLAALAQQLQASAAQLAAQQAQLAEGAAQIAAGQAQIDSGRRQLAAGQAQLTSGVSQLAAARSQLATGAAQVAANRAKLDDGRRQLDAAQVTLAASAAQLAEGEKQLADARAALPGQQAQLRQGQRRIALISGMRTVSASGAGAVSMISFTTGIQEVTPATKAALVAQAAQLAAVGVHADFSKDLSTSLNFAGPGEPVGLAIAALVLVIMLGSLLAAGLPLITALVGVGTGLLGTVAVTHWVTMSDVTPVLALMLGLAVGIDYALFIVHRHRKELARGVDLQESIGLATGTAGGAVLFAGMTVVVALAALTLTGMPFLGTMGLAAAATVAISVLVSVTLTPALLRLIGQRALSPKARRALVAKMAADEAEAVAEDVEERDSGVGAVKHTAARAHGWGGAVTRHPVITLLVSTVVLAVVAIPAFSLRLGLPDGGSEPEDSTAYRAYTTISREFGAGQNAAMIAVAKVPQATAAGLTAAQATDLSLSVAEKLKAVPDVAYVVPAGSSADHRTLVFQVVPTTGPSDDATIDLVHGLRSARDGIVSATGIDSLGFAGQTVANIDISERLAAALPLYLAVVVGISILLLLLVFRSVLVPLLATAGFLMSVAAAFGGVVAVYQWGWLGPLFGVEHPGLILSFLPILVIGILFGLAMDYQMFIVSGMREAWAHGHAARPAVRTGFSQGARVVTAAALIMTSVFASFIHSGMTMVRPIGFALAAGVLLDAFIVRMTAMPAVMSLLGEKAWWIPRWLERILPNLDIEGASLERRLTGEPAETGSVRAAEPAESDGANPDGSERAEQLTRA